MRSYEDQVAAALEDLPADVRTAALDDLRAALLDGATESDLGTPAEYAAHVLDAFARSADPADGEGEVFGVPFETRGPTDPAVRSRIWAPADPQILVPRMFGVGWTINLGAVAVRLGLLRPDDWDDESLDKVDPRLLTALQYAPVAWAAAAVVISIRTARRGRPVPVSWDARGRPNGWAGSSAALLNAAVAVAFAAWGTRSTSGDDRMIRPALGAAGASLGCAMALLTDRSAKNPDQDVPVPALLAVAAAVLPSHIALPVAVALRSRWIAR
jgi:hypothetical protein